MTAIATQPAREVVIDVGLVITDAVGGMLMIAGVILAFMFLLVMPLVIQGVLLTRPWLTPGRLIDRLRVAWAVYRYEFWLGAADVPSRRRRDLRSELHANLAEAAAQTGSRQAVDALGSLRLLAMSSKSPSARHQPTWTTAQIAGILVFVLLMIGQFLLGAGFIAGVDASGVSHTVRGAVGLPGYTVEYVQSRDGFSYGVGGGPSIIVLPVIVFVIAARPWRALRTRGRV
jgi:hypothetical protein